MPRCTIDLGVCCSLPCLRVSGSPPPNTVHMETTLIHGAIQTHASSNSLTAPAGACYFPRQSLVQEFAGTPAHMTNFNAALYALLGAAFVASGLSYIFAPVREGGVASRACECLTQRQAVPGARMRGVNACLGGRGQLPLARKDASTHVLDDMMRAGWLCECFMPNKDVQPPPPDPSYLLPT
jgi:hypothetical protein